ncbi:hypothetical protein [Spongiactinospora sp. TRM90649]|uniref:hypothetical protein n=1 Tax=Spongiactinospora sp. TRM90649 TaxID=3031114 RepID=UPI0023F91E9A|nr:hypothetical protein [Spongiactinospora sp. TRM90649]MDF5755241.1 hypothetical protein [Spongiactinospora sp. TRM90649]
MRATFAAPHAPDPLLTPCTGDWGALRPGAEPHLVALLPRHSAIVRSSASRSSRGQVLAANLDTVVIALSLATVWTAAGSWLREERDNQKKAITSHLRATYRFRDRQP